MKILFVCLSILFSLQSWAQDPEFELKGSLGPQPKDKNKDINFSLQWSEKDNKLTGTYKDNYFTESAPIKGIISDELGRIIVVNLPKESKGVKTITFLGSDLKLEKGSTKVPVGIVLRNVKGDPVSTSSSNLTIAAIPKVTPEPAPTPIARARTSADVVAGMTPTVAQRQEAGPPCTEDFGALAGYCGSYTGVITEERDVLNRCNLLAFNNTHLVLEEDGEIGFVLGVPNAVVRPPVHQIGRITADPTTTGIEVMSRNCAPMAGTEFEGDNCKRLVLIGSFSTTGDSKQFTGTYEIIDENAEQSCLYGLTMNSDL